MEITTKFNIDDEVYPIITIRKQEPQTCESCTGVGSVLINNTEKRMKCYDCFGHGFIIKTHSDNKLWATKRHECKSISIDEIHTRSVDGKTYIVYHSGMGVDFKQWPESDLFSTIEEAQAECDRRNAENG